MWIIFFRNLHFARKMSLRLRCRSEMKNSMCQTISALLKLYFTFVGWTTCVTLVTQKLRKRFILYLIYIETDKNKSDGFVAFTPCYVSRWYVWHFHEYVMRTYIVQCRTLFRPPFVGMGWRIENLTKRGHHSLITLLPNMLYGYLIPVGIQTFEIIR